jgi:hypothetical protein
VLFEFACGERMLEQVLRSCWRGFGHRGRFRATT